MDDFPSTPSPTPFYEAKQHPVNMALSGATWRMDIINWPLAQPW
ncbi:hypothetical protein ACFW17_07475 [Streptomyces sp. NPDC058961]